MGNMKKIATDEIVSEVEERILSKLAPVAISGDAGDLIRSDSKGPYIRKGSGSNSIIIGNDVCGAEGTRSFAHGDNTLAMGLNSFASGKLSVAYGSNSHAFGDGSESRGLASSAEGHYARTEADYAHAEGEYTLAAAKDSHAEGYRTEASGNYSHAEGENSEASGQSSHAEGTSTKASGKYSHAEGRQTTASANYSHAEGYGTTASLDYAHAEGHMTKATGTGSHAEGQGTEASGSYSPHAEGAYTSATGSYSHAQGDHTIAASESQHAAGRYNIEDSQGTYAEIIGNGTSSARSNARTLDWNGNGWYAGEVSSEKGFNGANFLAHDYIGEEMTDTFIGDGETVTFGPTTGQHDPNIVPTVTVNDQPATVVSHTAAYVTLSEAPAAEAEILVTYICNINQTAVVIGTKKSGKSLGRNTLTQGISSAAVGAYSSAQGRNVIADGRSAHAEGEATKTSAMAAHAEGYGTIASGAYAHSQGNYTIAAGQYQHAAGKYNIEDTQDTYAEIIGNGTADNNRSNARTLDWNGNAWHAGDVVSREAIVTTEEVDGEPVETTTYEEHHLNRAWTGKYAAANLTPFFSEPLDSDYWVSPEGGNGSGNSVTEFSEGTTQLEDGWLRVAIPEVAEGEAALGFKLQPKWVDFIRAMKVDNVNDRKDMTLLIEVRNIANTSGEGVVKFFLSGRNDATCEQLYSATGGTKAVSIDGAKNDYTVGLTEGVYRWPMKTNGYFAQGRSGYRTFMYAALRGYNGFVGTVDIRLSLYDGDYSGDYVPYDPYSPVLSKLRLDALCLYQRDIIALTAGKYKVVYDANDGSGKTVELYVPVDENHVVLDFANVRSTGSGVPEGFLGWKYGNTTYQPGDVFKLEGYIQSGQKVTFTAQWTTS